jgi:hypothetical protein
MGLLRVEFKIEGGEPFRKALTDFSRRRMGTYVEDNDRGLARRGGTFHK